MPPVQQQLLDEEEENLIRYDIEEDGSKFFVDLTVADTMDIRARPEDQLLLTITSRFTKIFVSPKFGKSGIRKIALISPKFFFLVKRYIVLPKNLKFHRKS